MDPDFDDIFLHARELSGAQERAAFLSAACGGDAAMRARLEAMLADEAEADAFFAREPRDFAGEETVIPHAEDIGEWIGPYRLLERIGEGGFGTVWAAQQEKPIRRRVALKVIKPGMDTREVIARFAQERQALAVMDHPNIARVLDAGATPSGRPYFVMELVRGTKITEYCDQAQLPAGERLELFIAVCQAVQHAHQKGIIHRDLKPSNILVTLHDGVPVPKVIDFGIAKATGQETRLTDLSVYTQFEQMIGTPLYMSPEQAERSGLDIDTRSDIYSLGVLLYELLTGRTPFDPEVLRKAGLEEMRRLIREQTPPKPSTALQTMAAETRTKVAQHRGADPARIAWLQRGDLDWIVMKAIEKDRTRRYGTANGLAQDLRRHLAGEAVLAAAPSAAYRFGKFARRNKITLSAGAAVLAALVIGLIAALWQTARAKRAEEERSGLLARAIASQKQLETEMARNAESELKATRSRYTTDINLTQEVLRLNDLGFARLLLDRHRPATAIGEPDLRGWEWRHLWQECRSGAQVMLTSRRGIPVFSADFSPDGSLLLLGWSDGRVELWNVATRTLRKLIQPPFNEQVHVAFAPPHGERFAVTTGRGVVKTVNVRTGAGEVLCTGAGSVRDLSWSPDGEQLAVLFTAPDRLMVLHAADGSSIMDCALPPGGGTFFNNVRISPDKRRIHVSCGASGGSPLLRCLSLPDARLLWEIPIGFIEDSESGNMTDTGFTAMDLSPDGRTLVVATGYRDPGIRVLDAADGRLIKKLSGHTRYVLKVAFSGDGRLLASTSEDQTIRLWNTATWSRLSAPLRGHSHEVNAVAISDRSHLIASGNKNGEVLLWDTQALRPAEGRLELPPRIQRVIPLPVSRMAAGQTADGKWSLIDLLTLAEQPIPESELSPGGEYPLFVPNKHRRPAKRLSKASLGLHGPVSSSAVSPDGKLLVAGSESGWIGFCDTAGPARIDIVQSNLPSVSGVAFSPDGERLALSSGGNNGIVLWSAATRQKLLTLSSPHSLLGAVQFTDDGNTLLAGSESPVGSDQSAWQFWRAPSFQEIEEAERAGVRWPQSEEIPPPPPAPTLAEMKMRLDAEYRRRLAAARAQSPVEMARLDETLEDLADLLRPQHRDAEAGLLLRELLERLKQRTPQDDGTVLEATKKLLSVTLAQMRTESGIPGSKKPAHHSDQADRLVDDVLAVRTRLFAANPEKTITALATVMFRTWLDRRDEEADNIRSMIERAEQNPDAADVMHHAAAAWCLSPSGDPAMDARALKLAQKAAALAEGALQEAWYHQTLGLAHYRSGNDRESDQALDRAQNASGRLEGLEAGYRQPVLNAVRFIRSMILFRSGKKTDARGLFAEAEAETKPLPADRRQVFESLSAFEDVLVWLACAEAKELLHAENSEPR